MKIPKQLADELAALPDFGFYGSVEISFRDSVAGIIKITQTKQLEPNGKTENNDYRRSR
jgi:hypothetical protein